MKYGAFLVLMEARTFKIENYITVPGFAVVELQLSGNELLCYSLIYGFTQDDETEFRGSLNYVASALNVTKQNAKKIIDRLIERGLIEKRELYFSGVKFCHYVAKRYGVAEKATGRCRNSNGGVAEIATGGIAEKATYNTNEDNSNDRIQDKAADGGLFPTEQEIIKRPKRTSEPACLFANSRYAEYPAFAAEFTAPEYADIDIVYYYHAVADWSAQKGKKMKDWIATARNFIRGDMEKNKLHRISGTGGLSPDAVKYLQDMAD